MKTWHPAPIRESRSVAAMPECTALRALRSIAASAFFLLAFAAAAHAQPTFTKSFSPSTIGPGSVSTMEYQISNASASPVTDLAFTDSLPAGVVVAAVPDAVATCPGTVTASAGGSSVTFSDGAVPGSRSCTISINVTASAAGIYTSTSGDLTSSAGNSGPATADLTVADGRPGFRQGFSPSSVGFGGRSTVTYTIDNSANSGFASNLSFSDDLASGLTIAGPSNSTTDCPVILSAPVGGDSISASPGAGFLAAGATCTVSVDVIGGTTGLISNVSNELFSVPQSTPVLTSSGKSAATLDVAVLQQIGIEIAFTDDPVQPGESATLEYTVRNLDRLSSALAIAFTHDLGATLPGLVATGTPQSDGCGSGSLLSGSGLLSFTGGNLAPEGVCVFSVPVLVPGGTAPGEYPSVTSEITASIGGRDVTGDAAADILFVSGAPSLTKTFSTALAGGGQTVVMEFTITNPSATSPASDIAFTDNIDAFLSGVAISSLPAGGFCGAGSFIFVTSVFGENVLNVLGASLAASDSCTFSVDLLIPEGAPGGTYVNTTSEVTATVDGESVT
ncbi:MAG: hypothetical protein MI919_12950, partial [Holophagales bacterium]|nr:hypothetical protein [Holophagales bacterium]